MICTFFGHRETEQEIVPVLKSILVDLIENKKVSVFLVGNSGDFDNMARAVLKALSCVYPHIKYFVVLAYRPIEKNKNPSFDFSDTIYPDILANTPKRYAIDRRNRWMLEKSDYVVTYVKYHGGASKFKMLAEKRGKVVIDLVDMNSDKSHELASQ